MKRIVARDPQQIRAVLVKFNSRNSSDTNLRKSKMLMDIAETEEICMSPDLTKRQCAENKNRGTNLKGDRMLVKMLSK